MKLLEFRVKSSIIRVLYFIKGVKISDLKFEYAELYNENMFHLTENVVWDDNFKRPLKVYTKPRSLIEVKSY